MHIRNPINIKSNKFLSMNNPEHCIGFTQAPTRTEEMPNECIAGMGLKDFSLLDVTALQSGTYFPLLYNIFSWIILMPQRLQFSPSPVHIDRYQLPYSLFSSYNLGHKLLPETH